MNTAPARRWVLSEMAVIAAYLGLAVVATWPVARTVGSRLVGFCGADAYFSAYVLEWVYQRLTHGMAGFWEARVFFPREHILTYADHEIGLQIFYAPARILGASQALAYNLAFFGELVLSGYGAFLLARDVTGNALGSFLAGSFFLMLPYRIYHADHIHLQALGFTPIVLLQCRRVLRQPRWRDASVAALTFFLAFLSAFYLGMYTALIAGIYVAADFAVSGFTRSRLRGLLTLSIPMLLAAALIVAIHIPMVRTKRASGIDRPVEQTVGFSARVADYFSPTPWSHSSRVLVWGKAFRGEGVCYLGLVPIIFALVGLRGLPREMVPFAVTAACAFVLSLGPRLVIWNGWDTGIPFPYQILRLLVPGFTILRVPARLSAFLAVGIVPLQARGAAWLFSHWPRRSLVLALGLIACHWGEAWTSRYCPTCELVNPSEDRAYRDVAAVPGSIAVAEAPATQDDNVQAMLGSLFHGRPVVNGYTAQFFPEFTPLFRMLRDFPSIETIAALQSHTRGDVKVRRVIWRRRPGFGPQFEHARLLGHGHAFAGAPLLADYGDTLVFLLRQPDELFVVRGPGDLPYPWVEAPSEKLVVDILHGKVEDRDVIGRFRGAVRWIVPMRRGPAKLAATMEAWSADATLPPFRFRIRLESTELGEAIVPWGAKVTLTSPIVDVRLPSRYTATIVVEETAGMGSWHPPVSYRLSGISVSAP